MNQKIDDAYEDGIRDGRKELEVELAEARAQIAAKDAALREALNYVEADQNAVAADIEYAIKAALAAPARETE